MLNHCLSELRFSQFFIVSHQFQTALFSNITHINLHYVANTFKITTIMTAETLSNEFNITLNLDETNRMNNSANKTPAKSLVTSDKAAVVSPEPVDSPSVSSEPSVDSSLDEVNNKQVTRSCGLTIQKIIAKNILNIYRRYNKT